jgi:NosR/NirI family transcriptional regulator, nitrous oxide reductase regulator
VTGPLFQYFRLFSLRLYRLTILAAAVLLIRNESGSNRGERLLSVEQVKDFFPNAASLDATREPAVVKDADGGTLGFAATTAPASNDVIGYSGPTHSLLALDAGGAITGLRILKSGDTPDHLAEVIRDRSFFAQFRGLKMGDQLKKVHAVSGATLTSLAIAEGVLKRLGQESESLRFPEPITLEEVRSLEPGAVSLRPAKGFRGGFEVLDTNGVRLAVATRTSPVADAIVGYKGPTDVLMLLTPDAKSLRSIRVRKSFETKRYLGYVTGDDYFMHLFDGKSVTQLSQLDFEKEKIEGVSGATQTSWALAEGLKQRANRLLVDLQEQIPAYAMIRWRWQDAGHLMVIFSALVMAFTRLRGHATARNLHHVFLVIYGGFWVGEMLSQGLFVGWARHGVPWKNAPGLVLLGVVALLAPVFTRRQLYCHQICPHGALQQLVMKRVKWQWSPPPGVAKALERLPFVLLLVVLFVGITQLPLDLNGIEPFDAYLFTVAGAAALAVAVIGLVFSLFTPMAYCKYGCPTGALFKLLRSSGDADRFGIRDWGALVALALGVGLAYAF